MNEDLSGDTLTLPNGGGKLQVVKIKVPSGNSESGEEENMAGLLH